MRKLGLAACAGSLVALVVLASAATALAAKWTAQEISSPKEATAARLRGVSCSSAEFCTAVGAFLNGKEEYELAELWNGKAWASRAVKLSSASILLGVSCPSQWCMAVGRLTVLELTARTVFWTKAEAVGEYPSVPSPKEAKSPELVGVSCTSSEMCIAVGDYVGGEGKTRSLSERWNGKAWTLLEPANPPEAEAARLTSVSCDSSESCTAVGYYNKKSLLEESFVEHWNGKAWSLQKLPSLAFNSMFGVSCKTAEACIAVGFIKSEPMYQEWNGKEWAFKKMSLPVTAETSVLRGVSCALSTSCIAVGHYVDGLGNELTLGEQWNGKAWTVQTTQDPEGKHRALEGVSCVESESCVAVGHHLTGGGIEVAFAEKYS
jgi:hypothetical protein